MSGHVAGCLEVIRSVNRLENEQVRELLMEIRNWEKKLSVLGWLDWKICGIEHAKFVPSSNDVLGRFGWEPKTDPVLERADTDDLPVKPMHDLAC
jgi:hypothetical protein